MEFELDSAIKLAGRCVKDCSGILFLFLPEPQGKPEKDRAESLTLCFALGNALKRAFRY